MDDPGPALTLIPKLILLFILIIVNAFDIIYAQNR